MFLSVIIPIYNCERTIERCLNSFLQALPDDSEMLLIDDASSDRSADICRRYAEIDPRIKVCTQVHAGPSGARNLGLRVAQGDYITFADSDDWIDAEAFSEYCAVVRSNVLKAELWVSDFQRVLADGTIVDRVYQIPAISVPVFDKKPELLHFLRKYGPYWNVWRFFFRKEFLIKNEICFPDGFFCAEDLHFMTKVFSTVKHFALYHLPYYRYTVGSCETLSSKPTFQRTYDTLDMIGLSWELLHSMEDQEIATAMADKITLEFIMKAALIWELDRKDRALVQEKFKAMLPAADCTQKSCRLMIHLMSAFGIGFSSFALFLLKRLKQTGKRIRWAIKT